MSSTEPQNPTPDGVFTPPGVPVEPTAATPDAPDAAPATENPAVETVENVGRGLLFSLGGIVVGVVLTLVVWQFGFIASITSLVLAYVAIWLYAKGAGHPPVKGAMPVVGVIVVGVALSLVAMVAADALAYANQEFPEASFAEKFDFVTYNLLRGEVWQGYATDAFMFLVFAGLGTFGLIRQLGRAKGN